ncbi:MAG: sugar phosphate isomerase/epimerase [Oscillospiraceae bacterium]|nr:sugar phosphate isomerase/epimerase [Oscillospiraceae bacterium]
MNRENIYISTTASDASAVARRYGLGIEIAEYCTAWNMDDEFSQTDAVVREKLDSVTHRVLHAPFNELFPCAIDRKARELAAYRYRQAIGLARHYGAAKVVIHGGYNPWIYYPVWYVGESIKFWKSFLEDDPGVEIVLENVLEEEPGMLLDIVKGVDDPRLRLCLDVGHVNTYSKIPVMDWLETWVPCLSHFHLHNNDGSRDTHSALDRGSIPMKEFLKRAEELCPDVTVTLELMEAEPSVRWLLEE